MTRARGAGGGAAAGEVAGAMDVVAPARSMSIELVSGRGHYERVIAAVREAHTSVWIATANVKGLMIEDSRAVPGRRRTLARGGARGGSYVSIVALLDELAARGVELRLLHAELPSRPFRDELAQRPRLVAGGLALARCPRVHMKAVIVDGELLYLGSANWTGAGLGAKGSGRRNFELGVVTGDPELLDSVQALYERVFRGGECAACKLRPECPGPLSELRTAGPASAVGKPARPPATTAAPKPSMTPAAAPAGKPARPPAAAPAGKPAKATAATAAPAVRARGASASPRRARGTDKSTAPRRA